MQSQVEFLVNELQTSYSTVWNVVTSTNSVTVATASFLYDYEGAGIPVLAQRINYAQNFYNQFK